MRRSKGRNEDQSRAAAQAIESLIARNALALRVAANGALAAGPAVPATRALRSLTIAPASRAQLRARDPAAKPLCSTASVGDTGTLPLVAPGAIRVRIAPDRTRIAIRVGVIGGMATASIAVGELRTAAIDAAGDSRDRCCFTTATANSRRRSGRPPTSDGLADQRMADRQRQLLLARIGVAHERITHVRSAAAAAPAADVDRCGDHHLAACQPASGPAPAASRERRLAYRPGEGTLELPRKLGPSEEIQELRNAFARAIDRAEESERETTAALEGQRRLVREVHHRVKNNLQVVASLLNIHGRSAETPDARAAYAGISRRVGRALDRPPQPFRRNGGESRDFAPPAGHRTRRRAAGERARNRARPFDRARPRHASTPPRMSQLRLPSWLPRSSNSRCSTRPTTPSSFRCAGRAN